MELLYLIKLHGDESQLQLRHQVTAYLFISSQYSLMSDGGRSCFESGFQSEVAPKAEIASLNFAYPCHIPLDRPKVA